jgi:predicted RND superfamily exporter protein
MTWTAWAAAVERHYRAVLVGSVLLSLACALSLTRLRLDIDVLSMLPRGEPAFDDFKAFVADFGQLDELFVLIEGGPPATLQRFADALPERLAALDTVERVHARVDTATLVDGMLGRYLFNYIPVDAYGQVAARLAPEAIDAQVAANRAILAAPFDLSLARQVSEDPLGLRRIAAEHLAAAHAGAMAGVDGGYFTSRDGSALLLFARPRGSPFDVPFSTRLLEQARAAIAETRRALGEDAASPLRVELAGGYVFSVEDAGTMKADIVRYSVLALVGVLAVFWLGYGNLRILPFVTYPLVVSTCVTFALSLLLYDQLNVISISFDAILYGLSIDSGIHFYTRLLDERRNGRDPCAAVAGTLAGLGRAQIASSATTAIAFLVVALSSIGGVQQLGVLTAVGMGLTTLQFFTLFPALGFLLMRRDHTVRDLDTPRLARWAAIAARHRRAMWGGIGATAVVLGVAALQVRLDPALTSLRPAASSALRLQEEIASRFVRGDGSGAVLVRRPDAEAALVDAERVAGVLGRYEREGLVRGVQSIDVVLPSQRTQRERLARAAALPREAAAERLRTALRAQGFTVERFAPAVDRLVQPPRDLITLDDPALAPLEFAIERQVHRRPGETIVAVYLDPAADDGWPAVAERLRTDLPGVELAVASRALLEHALRGVLRAELISFLLLSGLGNLVLLIVILRSVRTGVAVFAPVMAIVLALFAGMWLAGVSVDPINLVVNPLILGIGVNEGVYLATAARERGGIEPAMRGVGRALTITSLTTVAGFGSLAFSTYPPLATMGALVAIGLTLCLFTTVFVLPALLDE